jgi:hypothetical protein
LENDRGEKIMNWTTIYISGKPGFEKEVSDNLESSDFEFMSGSLEDNGLALYWIGERAALREFKKAIGSKTVFKYRLRFYSSVEEFVETQNNVRSNSFTKEEQAMIKKMSSLDQVRSSGYQHA